MRDDDVKREMKHYRKGLESLPIPDDLLSKAISEGLAEAKAREEDEQKVLQTKQKRVSSFFQMGRFGKGVWVAAAVLFVLAGCALAVYLVHPDFVEDNDGFKQALAHEYYVPLDLVDERDGMKVTLNGVIVDEENLLAFVTTELDEKVAGVSISDVDVIDEDGQRLDVSGSFGPVGVISDERKSLFRDRVTLYWPDGEFKDQALQLAFSIGRYGGDEEVFQFELDLADVEIAGRKEYILDESVTFAGQTILIEKVEILPLSAKVHVYYPDGNRMDILDYPDIRLENAEGKVTGKIKNGITAVRPEEDEDREILFIESNYFSDDEEIFLVMDEVQAIDKEEREFIYDLDEGKVVKAPYDGELIESAELVGSRFVFQVKSPDGEEFPFGMFTVVEDEHGVEAESMSSTYYMMENGLVERRISIENLDDLSGHLYFDIWAYPLWIKADEPVRIPLR